NAGLNQLNAVQQGTVTRISEFSPEEKRESIENLIGLAYFDEKKAESQKQLEEADRRLEIALARMDEIKKRIDELEEERNLKLRHDFLERELNRLNAISAANKMKTIMVDKLSKERSLSAITSEVKKFDDERVIVKNEIAQLEKEKSNFLEEVNAFNQSKATIDSELSQAMQKFDEANSGIITAQKRLQQINSRFPEISANITQIQNELIENSSKINLQKESIEKTNKEKEKIYEEIKLLDSQRNDVLQEQSKASQQKLEIDKKIKNLSDQLNSIKLSLSQLESERTDTENKINTNETKRNQFVEELQKLENLKIRLESIKSNHQKTIVELKSRIANLNLKKSKIENDLDELNLILEKSSKAANQYEAKIRTVKGLMHEDFSIAKLKNDAQKLGIEGLAYEMLSWDKQYERAILAAGSDWIKSIVVKDFATLLSIAQVAREKNLPKIKIIPIDAIPKFKLDKPKEHGVIGVLSDFVKVDSKYAALATFLFGNVILADSKESAYRISKAGFKSVTMDGEFFERQASAAIIDINSKISKLTKIISMSSSVTGLLQSINLLKKYTQKKKTGLIKMQESIQNHKDRLSVSETGLATANNSYSNLIEEISASKKMQDILMERISQLRSKKETLVTEIAKKESHIISLDQRISIVTENYAEGEQTRIAGQLSRLNEKKGLIDSRQSEIISELRDKQSILAELHGEESKQRTLLRNLEEEESSIRDERQELDNKIKDLAEKKQVFDQELIKLREKEQELISTSGTSVDKLKLYDEQLGKLYEKERSLTKEINSLERQSDSLTRDLKELNENQDKIKKLLTTFGFDENIETFDVEPILQALYAEQRSLSALNAKAPETYLEVSVGYRSMSTRKNSLEQERNSIVRFIEEIEKDKRQTFLSAFDTVDKEIRNAFTKMTGGNAWLELQNEDDIFNSGISYLIQFPNKPKRESTSISGGEKTLAAIVFVLALQKLKPSPFYLFDEVDAHLDAPNAERLSKILEERSRDSQFIMVSLKDSVVQKAKLIYGVYPKNGVSHVVTYKDKRLSSLAKG
ncbi:MAG: chromosome segregation protein SMC, partial [Nitrosopumilus sp.]|nr:chromosome segregation protein SMC [Nitrosopumilus sp.]NNL53293.1 chromosome segregation protein SMC [Nitrosopumilus sp.]